MKSGEDDKNPQVKIIFDEVVQALEISKFGYPISIVRDLLNKTIDDNGTVFFIIFCLSFHYLLSNKYTHAKFVSFTCGHNSCKKPVGNFIFSKFAAS